MNLPYVVLHHRSTHASYVAITRDYTSEAFNHLISISKHVISGSSSFFAFSRSFTDHQFNITRVSDYAKPWRIDISVSHYSGWCNIDIGSNVHTWIGVSAANTKANIMFCILNWRARIHADNQWSLTSFWWVWGSMNEWMNESTWLDIEIKFKFNFVMTSIASMYWCRQRYAYMWLVMNFTNPLAH